MNKKVFSYFLLVSLISAKCNAMGQPIIKEATEEFHDSGIRALTVDDDRGAIELTGWDRDYFQVTTQKKSPREELLKYLKSTISLEGGTLKVRGIVEQDTDTQTFSGGNVVCRQVGSGGSSIRMVGIEGNVHVSGGANVCIKQTGFSGGTVSLIGNGAHVRNCRFNNVIVGGVSFGDSGCYMTQSITTGPGTINYKIFAPLIALQMLLKTHYDDITARALKGSLKIVSDHGNVFIKQVDTVEARGSYGDITIEGVLGKTTVNNDHGKVNACNIGDIFARTTYEDISIQGARGFVEADNNHGKVRVWDAQNVTVRTTYDTADILNACNVVVRNNHGKVKARNIDTLDAETSYDDMTISRIAGKVRVRNNHGEVEIEDVDEVEAETSYDDLDIRQRDGAKCDVFARNNHGNITVKNLARNLCAITSYDNIYYSRNANNPNGRIDAEAIRGKVKQL